MFHTDRLHTHRILAGKGRYPDGSMSSVAHGLLMLVIIAFMLFTMDNYGGISNVAIRLFTDIHLTWEDAYEPLLAKILRTGSTTPLPARRPPYQPVAQSEVEMSEKDDDDKLVEEAKS